MQEARISAETLCQIMPALTPARAATFLPHLAAAMAEFGISTPLRRAAFLAQVAHESGQLMHLVENLNYSATGLLATWPHRFSPELAAAYARQPERIANHVYAGRGDNGDEASGDGWRYRGRGLIQLTFRQAYRNAGAALGLPLTADPDSVEAPSLACRTAGLYWRQNALSVPADTGDMDTITRRINGGLTGQPERLAFYARAREVLGA